MSKIKYFVFTLLLSIMFIPNVFAKGVEIKSIELVSKSDNIIEKSDATFSGLEMNFDLAFKAKNDNAKYKIVIKNDSNTDYQISEDTSFNTSQYVTYKYEVDSVLKAKSETTVYVTITYSKEVDESLLVDGKYSETNKAIVQLLDEDGQIVNPKTSKANTIILIILFVSTVVTVSILKKKNKLKYTTMVLIIGIAFIPTFVSAIETIKLTMNVKVEIEKGYKVGYLINDSQLIIKDSELSSYDLSHSNCIVLYVNSVSKENKYNICDGAIKEDNRLYSEGEIVTLKTIPIREINYSSDPVLQPEGYYLATNAQIFDSEFGLRNWSYGAALVSNTDYIYSFNDKSIMRFNDYNTDRWDTDQYFEVAAPQTFTMPGHNVLFKNVMVNVMAPTNSLNNNDIPD